MGRVTGLGGVFFKAENPEKLYEWYAAHAEFSRGTLDSLLEKLRGEGVWIDPNRKDYHYGRFAWIMDPEGNRIELWEPPRRS